MLILHSLNKVSLEKRCGNDELQRILTKISTNGMSSLISFTQPTIILIFISQRMLVLFKSLNHRDFYMDLETLLIY
jgi:hypothetical protein